MFTLVEALNYRCLRYVSRPLGTFHVFVGPNASGKTTFLDVIAFLGQLVSEGLKPAIVSRSPTFHDLLFHHEGERFELAVEAALPRALVGHLAESPYDSIRYEIAVAFDAHKQQFLIATENLTLKKSGAPSVRQPSLFPDTAAPPETICHRSTVKRFDARRILTRTSTGRANFYSETYKEAGKGWNPQWDLTGDSAALANLPADESKFPVATWFRRFISGSVQSIVLDSIKMRHPSPPGQGLGFMQDGSNLPWVIENLLKNHPQQFRDWFEHVQTALPELAGIRTFERPEDRHRYLMLRYQNDLDVPSWLASDGTLRLLALTLPAYLTDLSGVLLIEEPENGIHPRAIECLFESLSNATNVQVLVATHSPVILNIVEDRDVLCFAKDSNGATDIVSGDEHPALGDWQRETSLGTLFAAGVLG